MQFAREFGLLVFADGLQVPRERFELTRPLEDEPVQFFLLRDELLLHAILFVELDAQIANSSTNNTMFNAHSAPTHSVEMR